MLALALVSVAHILSTIFTNTLLIPYFFPHFSSADAFKEKPFFFVLFCFFSLFFEHIELRIFYNGRDGSL